MILGAMEYLMEASMTALTIQDLDEDLRHTLQVQAELHGYSVEEEARDILRAALANTEMHSGAMLFQRVRNLVEPLGGLDDLEIPPRSQQVGEPPAL